jgi:hypothetical protein
MGESGGTKTYTDTPQWYDPLGPSSVDANGKQIFSPTGATGQRKQVFDYLSEYAPMFQQNAGEIARMARTASGDSGWGAASDLARKTIAGDYLNGSPQLDAAMTAMRTRSASDVGNQSARIRDAYSRAGMGWSTGNQQAQEAAAAAAATRAGETEAQARLANYQAERGYQQAAPGLLQAALSAPMDYLSAIPNAYYAPLAQQANLVSGLSSGGQVVAPQSTHVKQPGLMDYAAPVAGLLAAPFTGGTSLLGTLGGLVPGLMPKKP